MSEKLDGCLVGFGAGVAKEGLPKHGQISQEISADFLPQISLRLSKAQRILKLLLSSNFLHLDLGKAGGTLVTL